MSSSRQLDDAVSIYAPSTTSSLPSPPHSPTQPQRSVRWKYENAVHPHAEFTKTKFMNKLFGGHSVSPHTPANSFRQVPSQDDSASTIEPSVMLLHHRISEDAMSHSSSMLHHNELRPPARWQHHDPPPPSATTQSRRTSPKVPERRKFFMERLFTVARRHVDEASSIAPPNQPNHAPPVVVLDTVDSATDASVENNERRSNKPWMRPLPVTSSPVTEPQSQHWYHPSLLPLDEDERVYLPAQLPALEEPVESIAPPTRWQLFWEDWVHSATSLHCIASCSAADFRCDDTSDFRSQAEVDFLSMHSSYTPDDDDDTFRGGGGDPYALRAEESLISGTTFETWDEERNSSYLSGWGSPATNDDATSFSSQNSAWI